MASIQSIQTYSVGTHEAGFLVSSRELLCSCFDRNQLPRRALNLSPSKLQPLQTGHVFKINMGSIFKLDPHAIVIEEHSSLMQCTTQLAPSLIYTGSICLAVVEEDFGMAFPTFLSFLSFAMYTAHFKYLMSVS
ncbi:hypothetical protein EON65_31415 [archaeon]|nr:MAG: hypothetical protein EON65_31415 [archaeon]